MSIIEVWSLSRCERQLAFELSLPKSWLLLAAVGFWFRLSFSALRSKTMCTAVWSWLVSLAEILWSESLLTALCHWFASWDELACVEDMSEALMLAVLISRKQTTTHVILSALPLFILLLPHVILSALPLFIQPLFSPVQQTICTVRN